MTRSLVRLLAVLAVCLAPTACSKQPQPGRALCPDCNVVLISMDTVRADHLGAYGYDRPTSPNVDRLARRSIVFENAISQSSWTLPAHGSMLSGVYPGRLGVTHYPARRRLPRGVPMLAEAFRRAGYATGAFTGGGFVSAHFGFGRGFDVYTSNGRRFEHNLGEALPWVRRHKNRPFFLFLHGYNAHRPYYSLVADKVAMGLPRNSQIERRGYCPKGERARPDDLDTIVRYYDASIHHGDHQVGRFLDALRRLRLMRNTVILITSDHGDEFFEHGNCDHVRFLYREVINVPYILYIPGLTPKGTHVQSLVPASISVPRTLLDIVGASHAMPGVTLEPTLRGHPQRFNAVYSETDSVAGRLGGRGETIAITTPRYKLIEYTEEGSEEAYDVRNDPYERRMLPPEHEAYRQRSTLRSWHTAMAPAPRPSSRVALRSPAPGSAPTPGQRQRRAAAATTAATRTGTIGRRAPVASRAHTADVDSDLEDGTDTGYDVLPEELAEHLRALGYVE